jgi:hypothetical protein
MQESLKNVCRLSAVAAIAACLSACSTTPLICHHSMPSQASIDHVKAPVPFLPAKRHKVKNFSMPKVMHHHAPVHHHPHHHFFKPHPAHHFLPSPALPQRTNAVLFVVSAQQGKIVSASGTHHYYIALPVNQIAQVLMYTQKPTHSVSYISGASLDQVWKQAHQNFQSSNPHAVLTANGMPSRIVRIHGEQMTNGSIVYEITSSTVLPTQAIKHINLTIDKY